MCGSLLQFCSKAKASKISGWRTLWKLDLVHEWLWANSMFTVHSPFFICIGKHFIQLLSRYAFAINMLLTAILFCSRSGTVSFWAANSFFMLAPVLKLLCLNFFMC